MVNSGGGLLERQVRASRKQQLPGVLKASLLLTSVTLILFLVCHSSGVGHDWKASQPSLFPLSSQELASFVLRERRCLGELHGAIGCCPFTPSSHAVSSAQLPAENPSPGPGCSFLPAVASQEPWFNSFTSLLFLLAISIEQEMKSQKLLPLFQGPADSCVFSYHCSFSKASAHFRVYILVIRAATWWLYRVATAMFPSPHKLGCHFKCLLKSWEIG